MKSVAGALILAVVIFAAGLVAFGASRVLRQLAADQQRMATLHYVDEEGGGQAPGSLMSRFSLPFASSDEVERQRTSGAYWQARYEALTPLTGSTGERQASDPSVLLIAAN